MTRSDISLLQPDTTRIGVPAQTNAITPKLGDVHAWPALWLPELGEFSFITVGGFWIDKHKG